MRYTAFACLFFLAGLGGCPSSGGSSTPRDLSMIGGGDDDLGMSSGSDGSSGGQEDLAGRDLAGRDMTNMSGVDMASGGTGIPCTPGSYRCGSGNSVEICNSTGSAWLYSATCAVSCSAGLCTGACTPGTRRCNVKNVEECNSMGTTWNKVESCSGSCSSGKCALVSLDVTMNQNLDGEVIVDGDVIIHSGVTVTSPKGDLTIRAKNITVENMATITAAPTGNPYGWGNGRSGTSSSSAGGGGGGNGTSGGNDGTGYGIGGSAIGSDTDFQVYGGGDGGSGYAPYGGSGGSGGGAIRLIASDSITVAGFVTANGTAGGSYSSSYGGGGGGGAGGGLLFAAGGNLTVTGSITANGGSGGRGYYYSGGAGSPGRIKLLAGGKRMIGGTISGTRTDGLLPSAVISSSSHPDPSLIYNDDFDMVELSWSSPFSSRQGYYQLINTSVFQVPTPATGTFVTTELKSYPATAVRAGQNYFHIVPVDAMSNVGTVENAFQIQINSSTASISSSSHPSPGTWYTNRDVFFSWSLPIADRNVQGIYYVLDNYGDTVPKKTDTFVPLPQKTLLLAGRMPGIWVMHVVAMDQRGYLTKSAAHFRVFIGDDPGNGVVLGQVADGMGKPISSAAVSINRGLYTQTTNSSGNFNFAAVPAGSYELRVSVPGKAPMTQSIMVTKGGSTTANVNVP